MKFQPFTQAYLFAFRVWVHIYLICFEFYSKWAVRIDCTAAWKPIGATETAIWRYERKHVCELKMNAQIFYDQYPFDILWVKNFHLVKRVIIWGFS